MIFNPNARKGRGGKKFLSDIKSVMGGRGEIIVTENVQDIPRAISRLKDIDFNVLGLYGGDGTAFHTLTNYIQQDGYRPLPQVLLLRGGTMNVVMAYFKSGLGPSEMFKKLLEKAQKGEPFETVPVNLLRVNDYYGFTVGLAMPAKLVAAYQEGGDIGMNKSFRITARLIASSLVEGEYSRRLFAPMPARLWVEGKEAPLKSFSLIMASTINNCGLGFHPFYRAEEKPGFFHFLATDEKPGRIVRHIGSFRKAEAIKGLSVVDEVASQVRMEFPEPGKVMMEGEFFEASEVVIRTGPRINLIVG
ncbi:MAG: diacylglycerol kinase family protein [Proteobacteria bacterium]|nr:diacylglycerol kinase family protein [Pseudomonadota bacterium]